MGSSLDRRNSAQHGSSGWHGPDGTWGDGIQHHVIRDMAAVAEDMRRNNGIPGMQLIDPADSGFAKAAAALLRRDGFVCVRDVMSPELRGALLARAERAMEEIVALDKFGGAKGAHRYMFGGSSETGECMHMEEWARLSELPAVDAVLTSFFGSAAYTCHGGGGDFVLPGSEYQPLHSDLGDAVKIELDMGGTVTDRMGLGGPERAGRRYTRGAAFHDPTGRLTVRDLPAPQLVAGFTLQDWGHCDGPTRYIAGTQHSNAEMPSLANEPAWMKHATVSPLPAGSAVIRDVRVWHGGCPAVGDKPRPMPDCHYFAPWYSTGFKHTMPREVYARLGPRGQQLCRHIVVDQGEELDLGWLPMGSRVTNSGLSLEQIQYFRANPSKPGGGGSMTGIWPPSTSGPKL
jgi:hypothetical protein